MSASRPPFADTTPDGQAVRERILAAAKKAFARLGYAATSLRHIADAAGVTKPMVFYYFGSKEGLYRTLIEGAVTRLREGMAAAVTGDAPVREKLIRLVQLHIDFARHESDTLRFIAAAVIQPESTVVPFPIEPCQEAPHVVALQALVDEGIRRGELDVEDPAVVVQLMHGALGIFFQETLHGRPPPADPAWAERLVAALWRGIGRTSPSQSRS